MRLVLAFAVSLAFHVNGSQPPYLTRTILHITGHTFSVEATRASRSDAQPRAVEATRCRGNGVTLAWEPPNFAAASAAPVRR